MQGRKTFLGIKSLITFFKSLPLMPHTSVPSFLFPDLSSIRLYSFDFLFSLSLSISSMKERTVHTFRGIVITCASAG